MALPGMGQRLSAEQIAKIESAATKEDVTQLSADLKKQVEEQGASLLSKLQESLAALKPPAPAPVPDPIAEADAADPNLSLLSDPVGFINRTTQGTQAVALQARADVEEMRARQQYPGVFQRFGKELLDTAARFNLNARAMQGFWQQHIQSFTGEKVLKGEFDAGSYPSLLGNSVVPGVSTMGSEQKDPNFGFTPDQAKYFRDRYPDKSLGEFAAIRDMMHRDEEPIDIAKYKQYKERREYVA